MSRDSGDAGLGLIIRVSRTGVVPLRLLFALSGVLALLWLVQIPKFRSFAKVVRYVVELHASP